MSDQTYTSLVLELSNEELIKTALDNNEGVIASNGAFSTSTGQRTGRSPNDRFIVQEASTDHLIDWGEINKPFSEDNFDLLWNKVETYLAEKNSYISKVHVGSHVEHYLPVKVTTETAWHSLFARLIFVCTDNFNPSSKQEWQIISAANYECLPEEDGTNSESCVIINFAKRKVIIAGMKYAGEMKKSMFSVQNFLLPEKNVLPMHCSANVNKNNEVALFFGLSGTGKTTLSADPSCSLIGDDEHGWSNDSVFNFEGGCYAKVINLNPKEEPDIFNAIREEALLENVVFDKDTLAIDFSDGSKTENTRVSYPIEHINNSIANKGMPSMAGHPEKIIFLTCDAYGVFPPVAKLTPEQAMYHFISGYTAKVAGTERGVTEPIATFSPCFGGPFLTLHPLEYAKLLKEKMKTFRVKVYLVNTGWVGESAQSGAKRFSLPKTRNILNAILNGSIEESNFRKDMYFRFGIPEELGSLGSKTLNPLYAWKDIDRYHLSAKMLVQKFQKNYELYDLGDKSILNAGPIIPK